MKDDLGYIETSLPEKVQALFRLLERSDPELDPKRKHVLSVPGNPRQARRFVRRAQRVYIESQRFSPSPDAES